MYAYKNEANNCKNQKSAELLHFVADLLDDTSFETLNSIRISEIGAGKPTDSNDRDSTIEFIECKDSYTELSVEKSICGQVLRTPITGGLTFFCAQCKTEFYQLSEFTTHLDIDYQLGCFPKLIKDEETILPSINAPYIQDQETDSFNPPYIELKTDFQLLTGSHPKLEIAIDDIEFRNITNAPPTPQRTTNIQRETSVQKYIIKRGNKYICDYCQKVFNLRQNILEHLRNVHALGLQQWTCKKCASKFWTDTELQQHHKQKCKKKKVISCDFCKLKFINYKNYQKHMKRYKVEEGPQSCEFCSRTFTSGCLLLKHSRHHKTYPKRHKCDLCDKTYQLPKSLRDHMKSHTDIKPFKCDVCQKSFPHFSYIAIHMRIHTGERPYQCSVCGVGYISSSKLSMHMRTHNGDVNRHKCTVCSSAFRYPMRLKEHMRIHTGEKPHSCEICGKTFAFYRNMQSHFRYHSGVKPFKCRYCDMYFSQGSNRRQHEKQRHEEILI